MGEALTDDRLLGGRVRLAQPSQGYRVAIDTVLLASAVPARLGDRVVDAGCGVGGAALCLAVRADGVSVTGIDADDGLIKIARVNAKANGFADRVAFHAGNISAPPGALQPGTFDHAMANPPYLAEGTGRVSGDVRRATATMERDADLVDWVRFCLRMVRDRGSVAIIHRADRLDVLLAAFAGRAGGIVVFPLWPGGGADADSKRVIVVATRGSAAPMRLTRGLVLHAENGGYTEAAEAVLRHGAAVDL